MADLDLGKKIGPLPAGAWVVVVAAGLGVGYFINRNAAKKSSGDPVLLAEPGVGTGGGSFLPISPPAPPPGEEDTNVKWAARVTNWLTAQGYDPTVVDNAVRKYLSGQSLSPQENAIIGVAIANFKLPPELVPGPAPNVPNAVSGLTAVATARTVTVTWVPSPGATGYRIVATSQYGETPLFTALTPPFTFRELVHDTDVTVTVWADNANGVSEPRSVSTRTLASDPGQQSPPPAPAPAPQQTPPPSPPPATPQTRTYTVVRGDNLSSIAVRMYGSPQSQRIYNNNAGTIEEAARRNGRQSSRGGPANTPGWYIYPGTVLQIV